LPPACWTTVGGTHRRAHFARQSLFDCCAEPGPTRVVGGVLDEAALRCCQGFHQITPATISTKITATAICPVGKLLTIGGGE
jgi:hypothetical protein